MDLASLEPELKSLSPKLSRLARLRAAGPAEPLSCPAPRLLGIPAGEAAWEVH
jgi:hypothetical protein